MSKGASTAKGRFVRFDHPVLVQGSAFVFAQAVRLLFRTLRIKVIHDGVNPYDASGDTLYIFSCWHDSALIAAFGGRHRRTVALTSQHRDGAFVAGMLQAIRVPVVRGSTGKRGSQALRQMLLRNEGNDFVVTPDGPRGPKRVMSPGVAFLASRSGRHIVPTAFACQNAWIIPGSWTDLVIPKPFSQVYSLAGEPIPVAPDLSKAELLEVVAQVQTKMDDLDTIARSYLTLPPSSTA
ncbi:MAG: lysophospholipid acyltransferase family protein [Pirellulaceae bacterium]